MRSEIAISAFVFSLLIIGSIAIFWFLNHFFRNHNRMPSKIIIFGSVFGFLIFTFVATYKYIDGIQTTVFGYVFVALLCGANAVAYTIKNRKE